jgi:putative FmdB family regulatory protein
MPIYEYVCRECRSDFEALVPASRRDEGAAACPQCQSTKVARKISLVAGHVVKSGKSGGSPEPFSCGAPSCCGGGCMMGD